MTLHPAAPTGDPVGLFYTWWRGDVLPDLPALPGLEIAASNADTLAAAFPVLDLEEQRNRQLAGHRSYLARVRGEPVAFGWSAHRTAEIGELGVTLQLSDDERYLWDFVTLPDWRGQGIYARMLQTIVAIESDAERFWIGHDLGNRASARGILKAGFQPVNALYLLADGSPLLYAYPEASGRPPVLERAQAAADLLGIPLAGQLPLEPS